MTRDQAQALTVRLMAAFPDYRADATAAIYCDELERLPDAGVAYEAVKNLIANSERLPPIALIRDSYRRFTPLPPPGIAPAPQADFVDIPRDRRPTTLSKRENGMRMRLLMHRVDGNDVDPSIGIDLCEGAARRAVLERELAKIPQDAA